MRSELRLLYCTDGLAMPFYSNKIANRLKQEWPIVMVGVASDPKNRAEEYVVGRDKEAYARHEEFFTTTIPAWFLSEFGIATTRDRTALFGYSCGGNFVSAMAVAHPERYRGAIAMSIAGRPVRVDLDADPELDVTDLRFYLAAGNYEMSGMKNYMIRLEEWLLKNGASCEFSLKDGDHNLYFWTRELHHAVPWVFE